MPSFSFLRATLLVSVFAVFAHGRIVMPAKQTQALVTSSVNAAGDAYKRLSRQYLLNIDSTVVVGASSSVVQDWSLVCKQLCGAGLGGEPCASHCTSHYGPTGSASAILNQKGYLICQDLCRLQLGDVACDCTGIDAAPKTETPDDRNGVCSSFCDHNRATLAGCSLCKIDNDGIEKEDEDEEVIEDDEVVKEEEDVATSLAADKIISVLSVTTAATPNWNELCATLCKTGDGGSLCNCDLSPFF